MWNLSRERETPLPDRRDLVLRDLLGQADGDGRGDRPRRVSTCRILVIDEEDDPVALFKGIAYIEGTPLEASA